MGKRSNIKTANDNLPDIETANTTWHRHALSKPAGASQKAKVPDNLGDREIALKSTSKGRSLKLSIVLWVVALSLGFSNFIVSTSTEFKALSSLAVLWVGLWTNYVAADYNRWRLSELAIVSALSGLISAIILVTNYFGLNLTPTDGFILMSVLSLGMGYVLKSRIAILASICVTLLWAVMSLIGAVPTNNMIVLFPVLTLGQIYFGSKIQSGLTIGLAVVTGYYGLIGLITILWANDILPLTYASALLFIFGVAHHRSGKAAEDSQITGSNIHIYSGWIVATFSAVIFQSFWLSPDALPQVTTVLNPRNLLIWKLAVSLSILTVFISAIIRFKHSQITLSGIFLLTLSSALIPLMIWLPNWPETFAANIPGVEASPAFGLIIGAGVMAAALGFVINGIRRHSKLMLVLGLAAVIFEIYLLMTPSLMTTDNIIIFFASFLAALAIGGTLAGNSLAFQAPAPRLKHA